MLVAAVLAVGGWWLARSGGRSLGVDESGDSSASGRGPDRAAPGRSHGVPASDAVAGGASHSGSELRPPDPHRRFIDFTPEQRVEFARRGHGPGG